MEFVPFYRDRNIASISHQDSINISTFLDVYRDTQSRPVRSATILRYTGESFFAELDDAKLDECREAATLLAFEALAERSYFSPTGYCNADHFQLIQQRSSAAMYEGSALQYRRRDGHGTVYTSAPNLLATRPYHVSWSPCQLKSTVANSLLRMKTEAPLRWPAIENAIILFKNSNTDSPSIPLEAEWLMMSAAFETILSLDKNNDDAKKISDAFLDRTTIVGLPSMDSSRLGKCKQKDKPPRWNWMNEFYRERGAIIHGNKRTLKCQWDARHHLFIASITFPLLVKHELIDAKVWRPGPADGAWISALDELLSIDLFTEIKDEEDDYPHFPIGRIWTKHVWRFIGQSATEKLRQ